MSNLINLVGREFGRLTVLRCLNLKNKHGDTMWECQCSCNKIISTWGNTLRIGHIKSCGCYRKERMSNLKRKELGEAARNSIYFRYQAGAKVRNINFNLSRDDVYKLIQQDCYYCGDAPNNVSRSGHNNGDYVYNGIDRLDNTLGYTTDNCVPCCIICNRAKNKLPENEFKLWISRLIKHNQ